MNVEVRQREFLDVVSSDVKVQRVATGFGFTEGPVWDRKRNRLVFSDMKDDHVRCWSEADGLSTFRKPSNKANGNTFDCQGRLVTCEHATSRVVRQEQDGSISILVRAYSCRAGRAAGTGIIIPRRLSHCAGWRAAAAR